MKTRLSIPILISLALLLYITGSTTKTSAKTENELSSWNYIDATINLDKVLPGLYLREIISPRLQNELQEMDITLFRSSLGYKWNDGLRTDLGYDWTKIFNSESSHENRIWQQAYLRKKFGANRIYTRLRLEEKFEAGEAMTLRFRTRFGYMRQLSESVSIDISDELLFNINRKHGFEQNRILLTLNKDINKNLTLSLGYQLQHFFLDEDLISHAIVTKVRLFF